MEKVCALAMRLVGLSINISKQSIITEVLYPNKSIKHCGTVLCKASHVGQEMKGERQTSIMTCHVLMTLVTTGLETSNRWLGQGEEY